MINRLVFGRIAFVVLLAMCGFHVKAMFFRRPEVMTNADFQQMRLCEAARLGCVRTIISTISRGADVNRRDVFGRYSLALAVRSGKLPIVNLLLAAGARPDDSCVDQNKEPIDYSVAQSEEWWQIKKALDNMSAYIRAYTGSFLANEDGSCPVLYRDLPSPFQIREAKVLRCFVRDAQSMHAKNMPFCLKCAGHDYVKLNGEKFVSCLQNMGIDWQTAEHMSPCRHTIRQLLLS